MALNAALTPREDRNRLRIVETIESNALAAAIDPDAILNSKWQPLQSKEGRVYVADRSAFGLVLTDPWLRHIAPKSMRPFRTRPDIIDYWSVSTVYHGKPIVLRINNDAADSSTAA